ncbi:MAG: DUF1553 domain-containing protein [Pirellulaceae bacterium]
MANIVLCISTAISLTLSPFSAMADELDFATDVLPILSDRCFFCHGPDANNRQADLRLDTEEAAHEWAIVPGDPASSELISRILSEDPESVMPPPEAKLEVSEEEKQILREWIANGAKYEAHWSLQSVVRPEVPNVRDAALKNPIDRFVQAQLDSRGVAPVGLADKATLIRRMSFDLTGLPPSIAEADAFMQDNSPTATDQLVDRLLDSRTFGERMAVDWLDVARYADTHGYQSDRYRPMWPWRDWVVDAFNRNLPYDEFITWQLAGDLVPNATQETILATGFNRNHRQTNEGGSVEEEFRAEYVADRVNTFGAAFLGLTLECCRCHDHKYDPISQADYYQLAAYFNSIDESGLYSHFTESTPTPALLLTKPEQDAALKKLQLQISELQLEYESQIVAADEFQNWRKQFSDLRPRGFIEPGNQSFRELIERRLRSRLVGDYSLDGLEVAEVEETTAQQTASEKEPAKKAEAKPQILDRSIVGMHGKVSDSPEFVTGVVGNGVKMSGDNSVTVPAGGDFERTHPFSVSIWLKPSELYERAVVFHRSRAWTDSASRGFELLIEDGCLSAALVHFWPGNALRVRALSQVTVDEWSHVVFSYDGSSRAAGLKLFVNGSPIPTETVRDKLTKTIASSPKELALGQRFRDMGFKGGLLDELRVLNSAIQPLEAKYLYLQAAAPSNLSEVLYNLDDVELKDYFVYLTDQSNDYRTRLEALHTEHSKLIESIPELMVMREEVSPRPTYILNRGAYDSPGAAVERNTPSQVFPQSSAPADRLELAKWLVHRDHPLTARVAVNRVWQSLFGSGLVSTPEDFGVQGSPPTHPKLLDWLAAEFMESGWDIKRLVKLIVSSQTYQRSSNPTEELLTEDPENQWLARGPAMRLPAEMIRDAALASSNLLVEKIGGPPVKPYQPDGLWKEKSGQKYARDKGEGSRRRSLYTYWKRTSPPPAMMTLDASNREVCVVRRQVTMTPLQMLVLLNDPQYVEAAKGVAVKATGHSKEVEEQLEHIFRSLVTRAPDPTEKTILKQLYEEQLADFAMNPEDAKRLLGVGDLSLDSDSQINHNSLAALTVVAEGLMSYDETVMKR